jgi:hypothetical protein
LRELGEAVFCAFGARELLELGALPEPTDENFGAVLARPAPLLQASFRDASSGVVNYLKPYVQQPAVSADDVN